MKHYPHLMARLFNVPLLIDPSKASTIFKGVSSKLGMQAVGEIVDGPGADHRSRQKISIPGARQASAGYFVTASGIAVVTFDGTLVHNAAGSDPLSGMTSYGDIRNQIEAAAADSAVRAILLDADTPGGEGTDSAFALSARIRELRAVKPIWGICDEMACSAGYLVMSAAEKLFAPALGYTGSIGVYMALLNETKADEMEGLSWTFIKAGAHKLDGSSHLPFSKEFLERMQSDVDATYARFLAEVSANRPTLGEKGARATEARFYRGTEAMELGLVDGVADFPTALAMLTTKINSPSRATAPQMQVRHETSAEASPGDVSHEAAAAADRIQETEMSKETELPAGPAKSETNIVDINAARKEGSDATRREVAEIVELCALAGQPGLATSFIGAGKTVADVRKELVAAKGKTAGAEITSAHSGHPSPVNGGGDALLGECKRLAESAAKKTA
jgi:signal peptide peptidase SppA